MNHPKNYSGIIHLSEPIREWPYYFGCLYQGYAGYAGLRLKDEVLVEQGLLNSYVRFEPLYPWSDSQGGEALGFLVKRSQFFFKGWKARREGKVVSLRDYFIHCEPRPHTDLHSEKYKLSFCLKPKNHNISRAQNINRIRISRNHARADTEQAY